MSSKFQIKDLVSENVATAPAVYHKLQMALANSESTFQDYAEIIQVDTSLAARLLKISNSPFFGFETKVESITHAMTIIGLEQIIDLALVSMVIEKFKGIPKEFVVMEEFWRHSIAVGLCARLIGRGINEPNSERYYLAGVLHDIGSLVFYKEIPIQARLIISEAQADNKHLNEVEKEILGFHHGEMGGYLLREWGFPEVFSESIPYVHQPSKATNYSEVATILHLADCVAYHMELGNNGEPGKPPIEKGSMARLGLNEETFNKVQDETLGQYSYTVESFLG
jgi:HD-like signal output (HDOD) protein